jgi:hypothetical protein
MILTGGCRDWKVRNFVIGKHVRVLHEVAEAS